MHRIALSPLRLIGSAMTAYVVCCLSFLAKPRIAQSLVQDPVPWTDVWTALAGDGVLLAAAVLLAVGVARSGQGVDSAAAARRLANRWGLIIVLAIWLPVTVMYSSCVVDGERYFLARDDQMVSLIYAKNWVAGKGLTWAGVHLEGYSNPLWVAWMALIFSLGVSARLAPLVLLLSNVLLGAGLIGVSTAAVKRLGGGTLAIVTTALAVALTPFGLGLASTGWEAIPFALLTGIAFCRVVDEHRRGRPRLATGLLLGVIALLRIDAAIVSAVLGAWMCLGSAHRMRALAYGLVGSLLPIALFVFRYEYFGDWLPNTVYLKTTQWPGRPRAGLRYVSTFLVQMAPTLVVAGTAAGRRMGFAESLVLGLALVLVAQVTDAGGDYYPHFRMLMPVVPLLFALAAVGVERLSLATGGKVLLIAVAAVPLSGIFPDVMGRFAQISDREIDDIEVARTLQSVCGSQRVAEFDAGVPFYFSDCNGVDLMGKIDRVLAHGPSVPGDETVAHNKYNFDYSLGQLHPGFVVGVVAGDVPDAEEREQWKESGMPILERFYGNPYFIRFCLPHPVPSRALRRIYRCDWSTAGVSGADVVGS